MAACGWAAAMSPGCHPRTCKRVARQSEETRDKTLCKCKLFTLFGLLLRCRFVVQHCDKVCHRQLAKLARPRLASCTHLAAIRSGKPLIVDSIAHRTESSSTAQLMQVAARKALGSIREAIDIFRRNVC
eukprot:COSAG01_NODE_16553_length_1226_cov_33.810115_3_plen_129_part_00